MEYEKHILHTDCATPGYEDGAVGRHAYCGVLVPHSNTTYGNGQWEAPCGLCQCYLVVCDCLEEDPSLLRDTNIYSHKLTEITCDACVLILFEYLATGQRRALPLDPNDL